MVKKSRNESSPKQLDDKNSVNFSVNLETLPQLLERAVRQNPQRSIIFPNNDRASVIQSYADLQESAKRILTGLRQLEVAPQDKLLLLVSDRQQLLSAFWGCLLGGFVPLILEVPPTYEESNAALGKLQRIWDFLDRPLILADRQVGSDFPAVAIEQLLESQAARSLHQPQSDDIAFFTLSSGSTGMPKCIPLTHRNIIARVKGANLLNRHQPDEIILNWLPFEHIGSISDWHIRPLALGCQLIYAEKEEILGHPLAWLDLIDRYRVTHSWAPNFAYTLIDEFLSQQLPQSWDLSCVRFLLTAGESIDVRSVRRFIDKLQPYGLSKSAIRPAFGMAELGSGITYYQPTEAFPLRFHWLAKSSLKGKIKPTQSDSTKAIAFADLGEVIPGAEIRIVDGKNKPLPEETIGRLQVKGDVVFPGYYRNPIANREAFSKDGWFNTGDLGFLSQGHLIVTGRAKETIIINGTNYYSQEIEAVVEAIAGVEPSYTAACAVSSGDREKLAIFFYTPLTQTQAIVELIGQIRQQVMQTVGINPDFLIPVAKAIIPKTAIGKIQRQQLSKLFASRKFDSILAAVQNWLAPQKQAIAPKTPLETQIARIWQQVLGLETVAIAQNFFELGGNSLLLIRLQNELETQLQRKLTVADLFKYPTISAQARYFSRRKTSDRQPSSVSRPQPMATGKIAVIGMSCRFPGAKNIARFWQNLCDGVESIAFFNEAEILAAGVSPDLASNPNYVKARPILEDIESFDADFFGYSPKEAELIDPQQRLLLECAWESLEDAGYDPWGYGGKIGIYAGAVMNTYLLNHIYPQRDRLDFANDLQVTTLDSMGGFQMMVANDKDYLTTRVSYKLNLTGPSVNVQTACSTSLVAVHLAKQSLLNGECDLALAGGVSIQTPQKIGYLYQEGTIVSPDGHCRAFDREAGGTIFGNGAGMVVLKRLDRAIADGDRIYAVIKGSALNNDGGTKVGYLAPNGEGQSRVVAEAIAQAGVEADTIGYVETHGTATILGDTVEIEGLKLGFGGKKGDKKFCAIGSVKTNIGHLQIASGIAGLIKTVLCLHYRQIPPSLHFREPSPQLDFANSPFYVNTTRQDWQLESYPRRAGVNSLGIGGTNVHVILEEFGDRGGRGQEAAGSRQERPSHVLTLSGKSDRALQDLVESYLTYLDTHPDVCLADICFTANTGRCRFPHRLAIVADSSTQLRDRLKNAAIDPPKNLANKQIAFLFTGQGSQYPNMGRQLYETQPSFRQNLDRCAEILASYLDKPLLDILYPKKGQEADLLHQTVYTQPALFALEYSLYRLWQSWGIEATVAIGHSLGEYVAACIAGVFSLEDALKLVASRGKLIQTLPSGEMVAVFAPLEIVEAIVESDRTNLAIAAINGERNIVISGTNIAIDRAIAALETQGCKTQRLNASHPFHSHLLEPILPEFERVARQVSYFPPQIDLISNLTGEWATEDIATPEYWCRHLCQPVQFAKSLETLQRQGCQIFLEGSSQPLLLGIARTILKNRHLSEFRMQNSEFKLYLPSLRQNRSDWQQMLDSLAQLFIAGIEIDWSSFDRDYSRQKLSLPTYPFQRQRYWIDRPVTSTSIPSNPSFNSQLLHPLLGQKLISPLPETIFCSQLNLSELTYFKDHRLDKTIVFPGAAYLEIARAAAMAVHKSLPIAIENVTFQQPLVLSEDCPTNVQTILQENSWKIYSLSKNETWTLHCQGIINVNSVDRDGLSSVDLEALQQQLSVLKTEKKEFYQSLKKRDLNYGVSFQGVERIWREDGEVLGYIKLPIDLQKNDRIHPALLDACFQVIFAAFPADLESEIYLPISLERLSFYRQPNSQLWSYVRLQPFGDRVPDIIKADIELFDTQGNPVIKVEGLTSKRTSLTTLSQESIASSLDNSQNWLYRVTWHDRPRLNSQSVPEGGTWVIFSDRGSLGQNLARLLQAQQQQCLLIQPGQNWQQAIDNIETNLQGAIYLWGLEDSDLEDSLKKGLKNALELTQKLIEIGSPRLWFVTQGSQTVEPSNLIPNLEAEKDAASPNRLVQACLWGLGSAIALEHPELHCTCIDLDSHSNAQALFEEIWLADGENRIALREGNRWVARLNRHQIDDFNHQPLRLDISAPGSIENLQWQPFQRRQPEADEVEIKVGTVGLNFRDVLNVLSLSPDISGSLGMECVGEIAAVGEKVKKFAVGDAVIAVTPGCLSSYVTVKETAVISKPDRLSWTESATMPGTFLTAYYTLVHLARIKAGDRILIHAAAGGVGLAAVQIAQKVGAEIFATASPSKWEFLESLGVKHLFNSRTLDFAGEIANITQGKGVDIVLNSLAGDFIPKSLEILNSDGCFIEIGKQKVWNKRQVSQIKPNVAYFVVDLLEELEKHPQIVSDLLPQILETYEPLSDRVFRADRVRSAFRYMAAAKHIGKIVIAFPPNRVRSDGTYLIAGGLGGLGLTVAEWMANRGAKTLFLLGRNPIRDRQKSRIAALEKAGVKVILAQTDIGDRASLARILDQIDRDLPPLRGIIHAAGVLEDGILQQQTWESWQKVGRAKIQGAWNLHTLTLDRPLDFFVLFSSVASVLGSKGQANYCAANAFLDAIAHTRQGMGLPALSINWGAWQQVGLAAQRQAELERRGMQSLDPELGLEILEKLLGSSETQVGAFAIDWEKYVQKQGYSPLLENLIRPNTIQQARAILSQLSSAPPTQRSAILLDYVRSEVGRVLGLSSPLAIDPDRGLNELGLDSLQSVELSQRLQANLECKLPATIAFDYPTPRILVDYLLELLHNSELLADTKKIMETKSNLKVNEAKAFPLKTQNRNKMQTDLDRQLTSKFVRELSEAEAEKLLLAELENLE